MEKKVITHWDIMKELNPELNEKTAAWRTHLTNDPTIPRKYKELMMVAMSCVIRFIPGIKAHAKFAMDNGATKDELFATLAQTLTIGGIPAYREGSIALQETLLENGEK